MPDVFAVPPVRSHTDLGQEVHGSPDDIASDDMASQQQAATSAETVITRMVELGMEVEEIERYR
jgi:hypothetical protein